MSDPTNLVEFRSLACHDVDGIFLEVTHGFLMPPKVRGEDYIVPAKSGRLSGSRAADVLEVLLEGYVAGFDTGDWFTNRQALLAVLAEAGVTPGLLVVRGPLYGLAVGDYASINVRVTNAVEGQINAYQRQTWSIQCQSVDPSWVLTVAGS